MTKFEISLGGQHIMLDVVRQGDVLQVMRNGKTTELRILSRDKNMLVLEVSSSTGGNKRMRIAGYANGDKRQGWVNGRTFNYERIRRHGPAVAPEASLSSAIPAVVTDVIVAPGDHVVTGQKLILLESMKMIIPVEAPYEGIVAGILCDVGDSVDAGVPLIELEAK